MDERQAEAIVDLVKTDLTTASPRSRRASTRSPPRTDLAALEKVYHYALRGGRGRGSRWSRPSISSSARRSRRTVPADRHKRLLCRRARDTMAIRTRGCPRSRARGPGIPSPPSPGVHRLLEPHSASVGEFPTKSCDYGEFCTTKHLHSTSTKHLYSGLIPSTKHLHHIQVVLIK